MQPMVMNRHSIQGHMCVCSTALEVGSHTKCPLSPQQILLVAPPLYLTVFLLKSNKTKIENTERGFEEIMPKNVSNFRKGVKIHLRISMNQK